MSQKEELKQKIELEIKNKDCFLNPDLDFTDNLIDGSEKFRLQSKEGIEISLC